MNPPLAEGCYFGRRHAAGRAGGLILSECSYEPDLRIPKHSHENPYLVFTLSGGQDEEVPGLPGRSYTPSALAFHPAGETHSERVGPRGMRCLHVEFAPGWMRRHPEAAAVPAAPSWHQGGPPGELASRIHREFREADDVSPLAIEGLVLEMLAEVSRARRRDVLGERPRWLLQAEELIRSRHAEPLSLSDVAAAVGVHAVRLARAFRVRHHCSVGDFIRRVRVEAARGALLGDRSLSLSEIGLAAGFADQAHFTRIFKRVTGLTPGAFRAAGKGSG